MNRRNLLALIGFAPVVGVAAALPRAENPVKLANGGVVPKSKPIVAERASETLTLKIDTTEIKAMMDEEMKRFERIIMNMQRTNKRHGLL